MESEPSSTEIQTCYCIGGKWEERAVVEGLWFMPIRAFALGCAEVL